MSPVHGDGIEYLGTICPLGGRETTNFMSGKYEQLFSTEHIRGDIKRASVKGGASVMASNMVSMAIEVGSVMVMARLLEAGDFGLIGMVVALTGFAQLFKDLGLSMATIQQPRITHEQVSLLFWVNVAAGVVLTIIVAGSAPLIAWFYGEPRLMPITLALACSFIISASAVQHQALLQRQMRFGTIAVVQIGSILLSVFVAMGCAWFGLGYWSLVLQNLARAGFYTLGMWMMSPWIPGFPRRGVGGRGLLKFGAHITGFNVVNYFSRNVDNILVGKYWGPEQLGFYAQAYKILLLPINQIRQPFINVGIPALSMLQNRPEEYRRYYKDVISVIALLSMPMVGFLFCCADAVIFIFLGEKWLPAAIIFRWLALVAFIQPAVTAGRGLVMLSMGYGRRYFQFGLVTSIGTVMAFFIGISWGAVGVAQAYAISNLILTLVTVPWCLKGSPVHHGDFLKSTWHSTASSLVAVMAGLGFRHLWVDEVFPLDCTAHAIAQCVFCLVVGLTTGGLTFIALPGGRQEISRFFGFIKTIRTKKKNAE